MDTDSKEEACFTIHSNRETSLWRRFDSSCISCLSPMIQLYPKTVLDYGHPHTHTHTHTEELGVGREEEGKGFQHFDCYGYYRGPMHYIHRFCTNDKLKILCASVG